MDGIEKKSEEIPFQLHNTEKHDGVDEGVAEFEMKVTGGIWRRCYEEAGGRGNTNPARLGGADQQAKQVAEGQTAAQRLQPVVRSLAGYQLVSHDVTTTTVARRRHMGPGSQQRLQ